MRKFENVFWGIVLIIIGIIVGGNSLGITNINIFFDGWWTLFIIIPCFIGLFKESEKTGNLIGILIGVALLLSDQDVIRFDVVWKIVLPVALIILGLSMVFKNVYDNKVVKEIKKINGKNKAANKWCAIFSGQDINYDGEEFKGTNLTAVFGGIKCDLRKAIINQNQVINCFSIFGGIDIYLPSNVKVKISSSSIFGSVSDDRREKNEEENSNIMYINATCIFGGIEIK